MMPSEEEEDDEDEAENEKKLDWRQKLKVKCHLIRNFFCCLNINSSCR